MGRQLHEIIAIVRERQDRDDYLFRAMLDIRDRYNGDWVMPMIDGIDDPMTQDLTPHLVAESVDGTALRAAESMPGITVPAIDGTRDRWREYAEKRRRALFSCWSESRLNIGMRRFYRHIAGYATGAIRVSWDHHLAQPKYQIIDPLGLYPEHRAPEDLRPPANCATISLKSGSWLRSEYPACKVEVGGPVPAAGSAAFDNVWEVLEWEDEEEVVFAILGPSDRVGHKRAFAHHALASRPVEFELSRVPNTVERCRVITANRVTLDKIVSQIALLTGRLDMMARLQTLAMIASEKGVFPDKYIVADDQGRINLVGGEWKDGRSGEINIVEGRVQQLGELRSTPDPTGQQAADRLERNVRTGVGLTPSMSGETMGALRTGRGIESMMAAAVDPRVQEIQELGASLLTQANELALDMWKKKAPAKTYHLFTGWQGDETEFDFEPGKHIQSTRNAVHYSMPGTDVQGQTIILGQLAGMNALSMRTVRRLHPRVVNPEAEEAQIEIEVMERAALEAIATQVQDGQIPMSYLVAIHKHRVKEGSLIVAIEKADQEMAEKQAAANEAPPEGMEMDPNAMPGLAPPGAAPPPGAFGAPAGGPGVPGSPGDIGIGPSADLQGVQALQAALSQAPPTGVSGPIM